MSKTHRFLKFVRLLHLYLGVFTAPMLLFFAITGGLQTYGLHEASRDSSYKPPAWLAQMGQLHKKQTLVVPVRRPRPGGTTAAPPPETAPVATGSPRDRSSGPDGRGDAGPKKNLGPMKLFFALVSLGLLLSTLTGLYMAYRYSRRPGLVSAILAAGVAVPLLLLLF